MAFRPRILMDGRKPERLTPPGAPVSQTNPGWSVYFWSDLRMAEVLKIVESWNVMKYVFIAIQMIGPQICWCWCVIQNYTQLGDFTGLANRTGFPNLWNGPKLQPAAMMQ